MNGAVVGAWVAAVVAAGGSVSSGRRALVQALVDGLTADGVWRKLDRIWIFAGENTQSALIDLVALNVAVATNSPTFTADRGYAFSGATDYIDTGFNPFGGLNYYTLNSGHMGLWLTSATTPVWALIGHYDGSGGTELGYWSGSWQAGTGPNDLTAAALSASTAAGLAVLTRTASNARAFYKNGSSTYSGSITSTAIPNANIFVGGINYLGGLIHPSTGQVAIVTIGSGLDATDNTNLYNRLNTYRTAVGVT
jgi:hypothetical protein